MSKPLDREQALIRAFVVPQPEERHRELPATPICRSDARFKRLDTGFALPISPSQQSPSRIFRILPSKGLGMSVRWF